MRGPCRRFAEQNIAGGLEVKNGGEKEAERFEKRIGGGEIVMDGK